MALQPLFEVAQVGKDLETCEEYEKMFSSKWKTLKTKAAETITPNGTAYTHSLGYVPIHLYAGWLSTKPTRMGFIAQNTDDNNTNVQVDTTEFTNDSNDDFAASALIYVFWEELSSS